MPREAALQWSVRITHFGATSKSRFHAVLLNVGDGCVLPKKAPRGGAVRDDTLLHEWLDIRAANLPFDIDQLMKRWRTL